MVDPLECPTEIVYVWPGVYVVGNPVTVIVPVPLPWQDDAQVPLLPVAPEYPVYDACALLSVYTKNDKMMIDFMGVDVICVKLEA
jgi:hypothetical protein